jgi:hypothetical protein
MDVIESESRMVAAAGRIRERAAQFGESHTAPDGADGETWELGQVLSHVAEFFPYWIEQFEGVLSQGGNGAPFGRIKSTPSRLARIEAGRRRGVEEQLRSIDAGVEQAAAFARRLSPADLETFGTHPTRGEMSIADSIDEFLVRHIEEHAAQLAQRTDST